VEGLSGGERQRVSVARAVAASLSPGVELLMLDEPFSGMDGGLRDRVAVELRGFVTVPVVSVTHDVGEAFLLGAEVVRISEGRVVEQGKAGVVLAEERRRVLGVLGA
jgi:molybdate transport system ATP-binding protein